MSVLIKYNGLKKLKSYKSSGNMKFKFFPKKKRKMFILRLKWKFKKFIKLWIYKLNSKKMWSIAKLRVHLKN